MDLWPRLWLTFLFLSERNHLRVIELSFLNFLTTKPTQTHVQFSSYKSEANFCHKLIIFMVLAGKVE